MFGVPERVGALDDKIRGYFANQQRIGEAAKRKAVTADVLSQLKSNPDTAAKRVGARYGVSEGGLADLKAMLLRQPGARSAEVFAPNPDVLIQGVADQAAASDPLNRLRGMLAGTSPTERAGQVAFYGATGGGAIAGLTAAGQGLMALMSYLQQGQEVEAEREQPLA